MRMVSPIRTIKSAVPKAPGMVGNRNALLQEIFSAGGIEERDRIFKRRPDRVLAIVAGERVAADRRANEISKSAFFSMRRATRCDMPFRVRPRTSLAQHVDRQLIARADAGQPSGSLLGWHRTGDTPGRVRSAPRRGRQIACGPAPAGRS